MLLWFCTVQFKQGGLLEYMYVAAGQCSKPADTHETFTNIIIDIDIFIDITGM